MSRPTILNQLGAAVGRAVAAHASAPAVLDLPPGPAPWLAANDRPAALDDAEILLSGPHPAWADAPSLAPPGWPGRLRWVQSSSTGVDWTPPWLRTGTPVLTCGRGHHARQIAEYVLGAVLDRDLGLAQRSVRSREAWLAGMGSAGGGRRVFGRRLGLAGFGSIGREVASRARAFGLEVRAWKRRPWAPGAAEAAGVVPVDSLSALAGAVDHLVLALPLTQHTRDCVDAAVLAQARPGLHLINIARGALVDQAALLAALDSGRVGFATLDVTEPEPLPEAHPFFSHQRVRLTPHIAWGGDPDRTRLVQQIHANLDAFLAGDSLRDVVDPARGY
ncbi:NAD(P)-binding domain-containing protein [Acetobacteraceae bacterium KSS8]|uniref:NAD(P)-binding domain-containing protein n=1 Tax=Endosaccharibacter trunci TaxID=2812733 RepID=A0ABT1W5H6_9PROT|nr:NAD(P)-binding domain-containing protein [Acetobacteraceae bacterium KSS8]